MHVRVVQRVLCACAAQVPEADLVREIDAVVQKDRITSEQMRELDGRVRRLAEEGGWRGVDAIPEEDRREVTAQLQLLQQVAAAALAAAKP